MDLTKLRKAPWSAALLAVAFALAARTPAAAPSSITAKDPPPIPPSVARPDSPDETPRLDAEARAPAVDVRIAPSSRGAIGAWLAAGPFRAVRGLEGTPAGVDESALGVSSGATLGGERDFGGNHKKPAARWTIVHANEGAIDLKSALEASGSDLVAYAAGTLHVERAGRYLLLLGVDDGVRVSIDGRAVYTRDEARPVREDDDIVTLDLTAGDHDVLLKLHQRDGAWSFRARVVDATLGVPLGEYVKLPGTNADDARTLASAMSLVSIDRVFDASSDPPRYRPKLIVRYAEGAPRGVPLPVNARLAKADETIFDVQAGGVPVGASGAGELVVTLPSIAPPGATASLDVVVAGRAIHASFPSRPATEQALVRATRALAKTPDSASWLAPASRVSVEYLTKRLAGLVARGDLDLEAQADEARELDRLAAALEASTDPYARATGPMRRAMSSSADGEPTEFGLYVPPWYKPDSKRKFPLIVALHGLNGYAMGMMRWLFGGDDPKKDQAWEDRHVGTLPPVDAFVVTPQAHGNTLYRELGETDVMDVVRWAMKTYPIDETRVTITGPSMGGIGSASIPFHFPNVFAAAMPLCGYHSYLIRRDVAGHPIRPWERFLAEERSNVLWAENGEHLPLFIVHGTEDKPEENSGVLIERYEKLNFSIKHEHPDAGHNVWQQTYEDLAGIKWLLRRQMNAHPAHVRFKTTRTRWGSSAWLSVDELAKESGWADVDARVKGKTRVTLTSSGASAITLRRDDALFDPGAITVVADGQTLAFDASEPLALHRDDAGWKKGAAEHATPYKHGTVTGPLRDVFYDSILFVYAAGGDDARANEEVARSFARIRYGVQVAYPVMSDAEFIAKGEPLANDRALFLVGRTNEVLARLENVAAMPIHVESGAVTVGSERFTGRELGAAFIRPNPARPDRYVVVVAGADVPGTLRALSLPDLLPDFVVWDDQIAPSRGQVLLGAGSLRAGGFFGKDWSLPVQIADPLARTELAKQSGASLGPRSGRADDDKHEHDATPYLP